ncbi:MAG: hypothetical protein AAFQ88_06135, partial [Pseudomonadota bacterium]
MDEHSNRQLTQESEVVYDAAGDAPLSPQRQPEHTPELYTGPDAADAMGGCHAPAKMAEAAAKAGKADVLAQFAADYPTGPHDKPQ